MKNKSFDPLALAKEILMFVGVTAGVFAWVMMMQLIISFVALSYLTYKLKVMIIVAAAAAVIVDVFYVRKRIKVYFSEK